MTRLRPDSIERKDFQQKSTIPPKISRMNKDNIIFDRTYEALGKWRKILCKRSTGDHIDPYLITPEKIKLRSNNDLLEYLKQNPQYWSHFDPCFMNFERKTNVVEFSRGTIKVIEFINAVKTGVSVEEALVKTKYGLDARRLKKLPKITATVQKPFRRKNYSNAKGKTGPKSVKEKKRMENKNILRSLSN